MARREPVLTTGLEQLTAAKEIVISTGSGGVGSFQRRWDHSQSAGAARTCRSTARA